MSPLKREWMKRTAEGYEGTHPLTRQHFRAVASEDRIDIWLDGKFLRKFPNDETSRWGDFINDLIQSEYGREDEAEEQKTDADHAAEIADAINTFWLYRMRREGERRTIEEATTDMLHFHDTVEIARLALPLLKDERSRAETRKWLASKAAGEEQAS
ncbi:MAG: hypothetical protein ABI601_18640 [bacterium]